MTLPSENPTDKGSSLARDSVGTTLTNIGLSLIGVVTWIAVARILGPQWRGALALVMLAPMIVLRTGTFGFDQGMVVLGGSDRKSLGPLTRTGVTLGLLVGLVFIGLLLGFMYGFPITFWKLSQIWLPLPFLVISLVFPIHLMTIAYDAAIYAEDRIAARNTKELVVNAAMLVLFLFFVFGLHKLLMAVVLAYIGANLISLVYSAILVRGRIDLDGGLDFRLTAKAIRLGFPIYLAQLATYIMLPAMLIVLSFSLPGEPIENLKRIAFFTMAYQMIDRILPVTRSVAFALLPKITGAGDTFAGELAAKASRHTLLASLGLFIVLVIFMHPIVSILLGFRYIAVVGAFAIMAPAGVAMSLVGVWSVHLLARHRPLKIAWAGIIGVIAALACAGIGFNVAPSGREVLVASASVVIGSFVNAGFLLPAFCREGGIRVSQALVPTFSDLREWRRIPGFIIDILRRRR